MENNLPKLYSTTKCIKCGCVKREFFTFGSIGYGINFSYKYQKETYYTYYGKLFVDQEECIKVTCGNCGYIWYEACLEGES